MKVLVTGANGMLGRAVVAEFCRRGHRVRAMIRPATPAEGLGWDSPGIEIFRADLRVAKDLARAFEGVDLLVHLAAAVTGGEDVQYASTVVGTERLLEAMAHSATKALLLASSLSVYDWSEIKGELTEESPLEADVYGRDGYAVAKIWQERLTRRVSQENGWRLTVLRPGFIWGRGNELFTGFGQRVGPAHIVVGPGAQPPLTHVANCAHAFVTAAERADRAGGQTFNLVDGHKVSTWRYVGRYLREHPKGFRVPLPFAAGRAMVRLIHRTSKIVFHGKGRLPSLFVPERFEARFKPVRYPNRKLRDVLGWSPPFSFTDCVNMTYGTAPTAGPVSSRAAQIVKPSAELTNA